MGQKRWRTTALHNATATFYVLRPLLPNISWAMPHVLVFNDLMSLWKYKLRYLNIELLFLLFINTGLCDNEDFNPFLCM